MKKSSAELKRDARELLNHNYRTCVWITLISILVPLALLFPFILSMGDEPTTLQSLIGNLASLIVSLLSVILSCGAIRFYLNLSRGTEHRISDILSGFSTQPQKIVGAYFLLYLRLLVVMLPGSILLLLAMDVFTFSMALTGIAVIVFIVGFILAIKITLQYNLIYYLYMDAPNEKLGDIFKKSKELMNGNKMRCFYLMLSFLGWYLLSILSFGVGLLWVMPYMIETLTLFYLDVLEEKETDRHQSEFDSFEHYDSYSQY